MRYSKEKKWSEAKKVWRFVLWIAVLGLFVWFLCDGLCVDTEVERTEDFVPIEIAGSRSIAQVTNKFIEFEGVGWGGGGAGGIATPEIEYTNFEDFIKDTEGQIYISIDQSDWEIVRTYSSFTSNRLLLTFVQRYVAGEYIDRTNYSVITKYENNEVTVVEKSNPHFKRNVIVGVIGIVFWSFFGFGMLVRSE